MRSPRLRHQLKAYLTQQGATQVGLLEFWIAAQELRRLDRKRALTSAAQIFYRYFHGPNPIMKLEKVWSINSSNLSSSHNFLSYIFLEPH